MSSFTEKKGKMPSGQIAVALSSWEGLAFSREPSACESWSVNKPGKCWVSPSVTCKFNGQVGDTNTAYSFLWGAQKS